MRKSRVGALSQMRGIVSAALGLAVLFAFAWAGSGLSRLALAPLGLLLPGTVVGLVLFSAVMAAAGSRPRAFAAMRRRVTPVCRGLLTHMGLVFVPAGVGVVTQADLIRRQWAPIAVGLIGSTVIALLVTGWLMHQLGWRTTTSS